MTDALRWGILATGGIAHQFTRDLIANGLTVQAVGSRRQATADAFAAEFGIPTAHPSYADLAADRDVDIVYVATPHPFHAPNAALALNAGKHVLVEKPITVNAAETRALVALAESKNLLLLEAMWTRFLPHMARIRELLAQNALGEVRSLIADHTQDLPDDPDHRINALALGGGALLDLGIYPVSFASALFGQPETILASASFKDTGADAQVATVFRYPGGQIAALFCASTTRGPNTASILGTAGRIDIDAVWYSATSFRRLDSANEVVETFETPAFAGRGLHFQAVEAERLVAAGLITSDVLPGAESVQIMATLDAIRAQIGLVYADD